MKINKKFFIFYISLLVFENSYCGIFEWLGFKPAGAGAMEALGDATVASLKQAGVSLKDTVNGTAQVTETIAREIGLEASRNLGVEATKEAGKAAVLIIQETGEAVNATAETTTTIAKVVGSDASSKLGLEATKEWVRLGNRLVPIAWVLTGVYTAHTACSIACETKATLCSSKKSESEELQYEVINRLLKAKIALMDSLEKNTNGKRGITGLPEACEDDARKLIAAGGVEELGKIIIDFKTYFPVGQPC